MRAEDGFVVVGITGFATAQLGHLVLIDLPQVGDSVARGDDIAMVESSKAVSDITAPISGDIVAINTTLASSPELANEDPTGDGWLFKMRVADPSEIDGMLDAAGYQALTGGAGNS